MMQIGPSSLRGQIAPGQRGGGVVVPLFEARLPPGRDHGRQRLYATLQIKRTSKRHV